VCVWGTIDLKLTKAPIALFCALFLFWILFTGKLDTAGLVLGIILSVFVTWFTWRVFIPPAHELPGQVAPVLHFNLAWSLVFFPLFFWEIFKATVQVAMLTLKPDLNLMPGIVRVKTNLKHKTSLVMLANHVTLTPGTVTVDVDLVHHELYVHSLNLRTLDECAVCADVNKLEERLRRLVE